MELPPEDGRKRLGRIIRINPQAVASMELPPEDGRKVNSRFETETAYIRLQWSYRPKTVESGIRWNFVLGKPARFNGATARRR